MYYNKFIVPFKLHDENLLCPLDEIRIGKFGAVLEDNMVNKAVEYWLKKLQQESTRRLLDLRDPPKKCTYLYS